MMFVLFNAADASAFGESVCGHVYIDDVEEGTQSGQCIDRVKKCCWRCSIVSVREKNSISSSCISLSVCVKLMSPVNSLFAGTT